MLSDAELVKACGVNIMGWTEVIEPPLAEGQFGLNSFGLCVPTGASEDDWVIWNPLTDETDCAAVLTKDGAQTIGEYRDAIYDAIGAIEEAIEK